MKKIITISREFGAGAGEIGKKVAKELGYEYYDKSKILREAIAISNDLGNVLQWNGKAAVDFGLAQSLFDFYHRPLNEKVFQTQQQVIQKLGEKGNCVIVGRNANSVLYHYDNSLHVFVCADSDWRVERMLKLYPDSTRKQMTEQMLDVDKRRRKYCSTYTNTEFGNAKYYDLCACTSRLGIDTVADMILKLAREE